ncbi:MAG: 5'-nucleotidase C-terminal domain-containing protein [Pyrinomonas methylaliphatogenes]|nr:5'-nucleotidase C-terminal domain-containing protein [Pyrinomonas methylaliphatogenes]
MKRISAIFNSLRGRHSFFALLTIVALFAPALAQSNAKPQHAWITILSTTDMHGNIFPIDYYTNREDARGLARLATLIKQARRENPHSLLIDSGDTIQGTPLVYLHHKRMNDLPDPMMLAMNALRYDAMAVGNHEFNFGLQVIEKARREAHFPWLSANTYRVGTDETFFQPYVVKEVAGVRVGILGLTTPGIPNWENPENYAGLEFRDPLTEAKKWVSILRERERVDLVVIAMHMGLEEDLRAGADEAAEARHENAALAIAREVSGVDVILMGHTHREVPALFVNGVLLTQANRWATHLARADLYLDKMADGRWRIAAKGARTISVQGVAEDPEIVKLAEPYHRATQEWLSRPIGWSDKELSARDARFHDSAILDLIHRVQLEVGHADVSLAAVFNPQARIPRGAVTVRDIASLYVYENTLVVIEVTGKQLKDALEHAARYFKPYAPGKTAAELVDERIPGYNFDIAEGVDYEIDLTKPVGQRIQNLRFHGQPVRPDQKFRLATNNYRYNGGGGYTMLKGAPVLYRTSQEIRELIIEWVEKHKTIPTEPTNNWRLLPVEVERKATATQARSFAAASL